MSETHVELRRGLFRDSVQLMQLTEALRSLPSVEDAALVMGTPLNKQLLRDGGFVHPALEQAGAEDLVIAYRLRDGALAASIAARIEHLLTQPAATTFPTFEDIKDALQAHPDVNVALVSVPGAHASPLAEQLLRHGAHVFLFSDHVPLAEEVRLKKLGASRGLLLMGAEAGTTILNGVGFGFANAVPHGRIGIIGATGTGIQELATLLERFGEGVSHAIGVGGRDLDPEVNGLMTREAIRFLARDADTQLVLVVSKPATPEVEATVAAELAQQPKPTLLCVLGPRATERAENGQPRTLYAAALHAVARLRGQREPSADIIGPLRQTHHALLQRASALAQRLQSGQRWIRGLFAGGTLCYEAQLLLQSLVGPVYSNAPLDPAFKLPQGKPLAAHSCVDYGAEEFTEGRPHPIMDARIRRQHLLQHVEDPAVAVLLVDLILGYGATASAQQDLLDAIAIVQDRARMQSRTLPVVLYPLGSASERTQRDLESFGDDVLIAPSNALATVAAVVVAERVKDTGRLDGKLTTLLGVW